MVYRKKIIDGEPDCGTMEHFFEELKRLLNEEDRFCRYNGIRVETICPGAAEAVMESRLKEIRQWMEVSRRADFQ